MRILSRYILRETLPSLFLGFLLFSSMVMLERVLKLVNLVMDKDLPLDLAGRLLMLYFPFTMPLTIPMALLMAVLMAFGRLAADNEILVLRACGYNVARLVLPLIVLGLTLSLVTLTLSDTVATHSFAMYKQLLYEITQRSRLITIQPHVDINLNNYKLYVEGVNNEEQTLRGITLNEMSGDRRTIVAMSGRWYREGDQALVFALFDAVVHRSDPGGSYYVATERKFTFRVDLANPLLGVRESNYSELALRELLVRQAAAREQGKNERPYIVEFHKRLALPFACLAFVCAGVPLGMMARKSGRTIGFGLSLLLIFAYYLMFIGSEPLALQGKIPAWSMWLPNALFIVAGLWGLARQARQ